MPEQSGRGRRREKCDHCRLNPVRPEKPARHCQWCEIELPTHRGRFCSDGCRWRHSNWLRGKGLPPPGRRGLIQK